MQVYYQAYSSIKKLVSSYLIDDLLIPMTHIVSKLINKYIFDQVFSHVTYIINDIDRSKVRIRYNAYTVRCMECRILCISNVNVSESIRCEISHLINKYMLVQQKHNYYCNACFKRIFGLYWDKLDIIIYNINEL
jgi:hypothetical protein